MLSSRSGSVVTRLTTYDRGTGNTLPFSCYKDDEERLASHWRAPVATNASDISLGQVWAEVKNKADACVHAQNETGRLIGTAFTARDIMNVVDALDEDGKLRYFGKCRSLASIQIRDSLY